MVTANIIVVVAFFWPPGVNGSNGDVGPARPPGSPGYNATQGHAGPPAIPGVQGLRGPSGFNGTKGQPGPGASSCVFKTLTSTGTAANPIAQLPFAPVLFALALFTFFPLGQYRKELPWVFSVQTFSIFKQRRSQVFQKGLTASNKGYSPDCHISTFTPRSTYYNLTQ